MQFMRPSLEDHRSKGTGGSGIAGVLLNSPGANLEPGQMMTGSLPDDT
jgi:hypothetical protein